MDAAPYPERLARIRVHKRVTSAAAVTVTGQFHSPESGSHLN
jgi:hypothetical protein